MSISEKKKQRRGKVARELAIAAQHLRHYGESALAEQVDKVATGVYIGQIIDRPVQ